MENKEEPQTQENIPEEPKEEEYSFMQETIKDETGSRKKTRNLIMKYAGLGLIFGAAACLGFCALKPLVEDRFMGNPKEVSLPAEEEETEEGTTEETQEVEVPALTVDSYREMNRALYSVGSEVNKSVAEITAITSEPEWQEDSYDEKNSVSGVVVFDNGQEILIFAKSSVQKGAESLRATFADGSEYNAQVKKSDDNLGFAIYSVARNDISESTWGQLKAAVLGSSKAVGKGDALIAVGSPFGYSGGMGYGVVASAKNKIVKADGEYSLLCTDISAAENGSGVLANLRGEVVGIIDQTVADGDSMNLVTAYGISDIKAMIELMSNNNAVPYVGITGVTITEEISTAQGIPKGVYVQEIRTDSPAMEAGIQSGDVITRVDGKAVSTLSAYHDALMNQTVGDKIKISGQRQGTNGYVDISFTVTIGSKE